jgi:hypothetical protein
MIEQNKEKQAESQPAIDLEPSRSTHASKDKPFFGDGG